MVSSRGFFFVSPLTQALTVSHPWMVQSSVVNRRGLGMGCVQLCVQ